MDSASDQWSDCYITLPLIVQSTLDSVKWKGLDSGQRSSADAAHCLWLYNSQPINC